MIKSLFDLRSIHSRKEYSVKTNISIQPCISCWVTKWIKQPGYSWDIIKLFFQKLMSYHNIIENVFIIWTIFIICSPTSIQELKPSLFNNFSNGFLHSFGLSIKPHWKILHLRISKLEMRLLNELFKNRIEDHWNSAVMGCIKSAKIFINCLKPAYIIVSVSYHVHV